MRRRCLPTLFVDWAPRLDAANQNTIDDDNMDDVGEGGGEENDDEDNNDNDDDDDEDIQPLGNIVAPATQTTTTLANEWRSLLRVLRNEDRLPALAFAFNRTMCEQLMLLAFELCKSEHESKLARVRGAVAQLRVDIERLESEMTRAKTAERREQLQSEIDSTKQSIGNKLGVDRDCSLAANPMSVDALKEQFWWFNESQPSHMALAFGVACHHAGLPTKYRRAVEQLFRAKSLGVVVATTTLSQGIHAPCRTVVLCHDSTYLNPTSFKQMIGRAGRRGFDSLGRVVIWRIRASKLRLLMTTGAATLHGNAVLTASVLMQQYMRLTAWRCNNTDVVEYGVKRHALLSGMESAADVVRDNDEARVVEACEALLTRSIWTMRRPTLAVQLRDIAAMGLALLRERGFINAQGLPIGLCSLIARLSYIEPANFFIARLLQSGDWSRLADHWHVLPENHEQLMQEGDRSRHQRTRLLVPSGALWARLDDDNERVLDALLCDLARLVYPVPVARSAARRGGPSLVALPPASEMLKALATREEREACEWVVRHFKRQLATPGVGAAFDCTEACTLPLSRVAFARRCEASRLRLRSPFVALRGANYDDDAFASLAELERSIRSDVFFERQMVPAWSASPHSALNAYAFDFYRHRQLSALARYNEMRDAFLAVDQFNAALQTIAVATHQVGCGWVGLACI